jgi:hypothetical protein
MLHCASEIRIKKGRFHQWRPSDAKISISATVNTRQFCASVGADSGEKGKGNLEEYLNGAHSRRSHPNWGCI